MTFSARLKQLDSVIYALEEKAVALCFATMTVIVFVAVVWRLFAAPVGKIEQLLNALMGSPQEWTATAGNLLGFFLWLGLALFAVYTAQRPKQHLPDLAPNLAQGGQQQPEDGWPSQQIPSQQIPWQKTPWQKILWVGGAIAMGSTGLAMALVWLIPEGIIFSQRLALSLMMWVVLLGSSMAAYTRRHIFLRAAQKLVDKKQIKNHAAVSLVVASLFAIFIAYVGYHYALSNISRWVSSDWRAGKWDSIPIPYWSVTVAIPIGFGLTAIRFLAQAIGVWNGSLAAVPDDDDIDAAAKMSDVEEVI